MGAGGWQTVKRGGKMTEHEHVIVTGGSGLLGASIVRILIEEIISKPLKDAKSRLQETVQARSYPTPKYTVVEESGPDHSKTFIVEVRINGKTLSRGRGKNKSEAEQKAAEKALKNFS